MVGQEEEHEVDEESDLAKAIVGAVNRGTQTRHTM